MKLKKGRSCLMIVLMLVLIAGFTSARAAEEKKRDFELKCQDTRNLCTTSFFKSHTEISCSYRPADWEKSPVWSYIVVVYKCNRVLSGKEGWTCKGYLGALPDVKATFTVEEFHDDDLRCNKICAPCPAGWQ